MKKKSKEDMKKENNENNKMETKIIYVDSSYDEIVIGYDSDKQSRYVQINKLKTNI